MTTNYPESLDTALVRPGRVDLSIHLGNATTEYQAEILFKRFYTGALEDQNETNTMGAQLAKEVETQSFRGQSVSMGSFTGTLYSQ